MTIKDIKDIMVNEGLKIKGVSAHRGADLMPCHCGSNDVVYVSYKGGWFVKCLWCECMVAKQISVVTETILPFETREDAAKVWNKRAAPTTDLRKFERKVSPEDIIKMRNARAKAIAKSIRNAGGAVVSRRDIASDVGLSTTTIANMMHYVKKAYPNVKTVDRTGYFWEENNNE